MSRVLVLGAYGMIGAALTRHLMAQGHHVTGLGRSIRTARKVFPGLDWYVHDIGAMTLPSDWLPYLRDIDVVVNAAGALQDGPRDDLTAVHATAIAALAEACATHGTGLIQISASGVDAASSTHFFRSKAAGDAAIRASGARHWILRPGLVICDTAYGGTALLRMLAAVPMIQPLAMAEARVQTVGMPDLARAVAACVAGDIPAGTKADLVEDKTHSVADIVADLRAWLGFAPARTVITAPGWLLNLTARGADLLGRFGWRSPLRSTALATLQDGVQGDASEWRAAGGPAIAGLEQTLAQMPARSEDRLSARLRLAQPLVIAVLALFWALSGLIGLVRLDAATATLVQAGWPTGVAQVSVVSWGLVDIALGLALLWRPTAHRAVLGMVAVSLIYLVLGTVITPWLWADPLGPLLKILPGLVLALVALPLLDNR